MFGKRPVRPDLELDRMRRRAESIPTPDLVSWAEQALFGIGRHLDGYRRSRSDEDLQEARHGSLALRAVLDEIAKRQ